MPGQHGNGQHDMETPCIHHNELAHQFEAEDAGALAVLQYDRAGDQLILLHMEVPPELTGRGIGDALVRVALAHAKAHNLLVVAQCSYVQIYLHRRLVDSQLVDSPSSWSTD